MDSLTFDIRDRVAYVTFTRPAELNSISEAALGDLEQVCDRVGTDESIRAMVITGSGSTFCVGLDIDLLRRAFIDAAYFESVLHRYGAVLTTIESLDVPVVAAVNGLARAGGFELILACDLVIVASEVKIGDNHTSFGVIPGGGSTQRLPRKVGPMRAAELIMTARWLSGPEAVDYGLALRSVAGDQLEAAVEDLVSQLRVKPRASLAAVKRVMRRGSALPMEDALEVEIEEFIARLTSPESESVEGFTAYVEGRAPRWA